MLKSYENFLARVKELGFMPLSASLPGLPSLTGETAADSWHTGNPATDPWCWKDRAAADKKLAFGAILGGHKGFIAPYMYSFFFRAYHPQQHMEERWAAGEVSQTTWQLWQLFQDQTLLSTSEIRKEMGVTAKKGGSRVDRAIKELQQHYYITVAGNRRKKDKKGQPYGWPALVYDRVKNWIPREWLAPNTLSCSQAREEILHKAQVIGDNLVKDQIATFLNL